MEIKVSLSVKNNKIVDDIIEIDETKLEELTDDEIESAIEVYISEWANRNVNIAWEVLKTDEDEEDVDEFDEDEEEDEDLDEFDEEDEDF